VTLWSARPKLRLRITRMVTAGTRTLTVALPKAWRHALARRPTMRARLRVVLTAGDGASAHDEATLRLSHH
jgi:hypothetical protein